ncbi:autotransporter outer membrane beta-barrel domain-containing protein [Microvirgula curvata]
MFRVSGAMAVGAVPIAEASNDYRQRTADNQRQQLAAAGIPAGMIDDALSGLAQPAGQRPVTDAGNGRPSSSLPSYPRLSSGIPISSTKKGPPIRRVKSALSTGNYLDKSLRPTRMLGKHFGRVADNVAEDGSGFGINLVSRGQPGTRIGDASYGMVVMQQRFTLGDDAQLTTRYGIARLQAGSSNGVSQFAGLRHVQTLDAGLKLESEFHYARHQSGQQYEPGSEPRRDQLAGQIAVALPYAVGTGMKVEPLFGLALRHDREMALNARAGSGDLLRLSAQSDKALDGVLGVRLAFRGAEAREGRGWRIDAEALARPQLYRQDSGRSAHWADDVDTRVALPGNPRSRFGYDGRLSISHRSKDRSLLSVSAYASRSDGMNDRGIMTTYQSSF